MTFGIGHAGEHLRDCAKVLGVAKHFCSTDSNEKFDPTDLLAPMKKFEEPPKMEEAKN